MSFKKNILKSLSFHLRQLGSIFRSMHRFLASRSFTWLVHLLDRRPAVTAEGDPEESQYALSGECYDCRSYFAALAPSCAFQRGPRLAMRAFYSRARERGDGDASRTFRNVRKCIALRRSSLADSFLRKRGRPMISDERLVRIALSAELHQSTFLNLHSFEFY